LKKQLAILLLLCYTMVWLRPLVPVVSDWLAHTFWLSEHVATVHYENGHYHVHYELKEIAKDTENSAPQNTSDKTADETVIPVHLLSDSGEFILFQNTTSAFIPRLHGIIQHTFRTVPTPPPWC
jgi:hypothetical protein